MTKPGAGQPVADVRRAILLMAAFALTWAMLELVVASWFRGTYSLLQVVWCRYFVHLAVMVAIVGRRSPGRLWRTSRPFYQLGRSLLMLVMPASFMLALRWGVSFDSTWSLFWLAPLLVTAGAGLLLGEVAPAWAWMAALVGAVAAALVHPLTLPSPPWILAMPVAMAGSFSLYVVMTRRLRDEPVGTNLFHTALGVFVLLTPLMPHVWVTPPIHDALVMAAIGLVGLLALYLLDRAAAAAPLAVTAPALIVHVAGIVVLTWVLGRSAPTRRDLAGLALALLVAAATWMQAARDARACVAIGQEASG